MAALEAMSDELGGCSLRELSGMLRNGDLTSRELFERTNELANTNHALGAFVTIAPELGAMQADNSDQRLRSGNARALEGLPMPIKDVEATKGLRTTQGSRAFEQWIPTEDGGAAHAVREAGANLFLKTNTTELALTEQSDNPLEIVTRNPLDTALTTGGSSAGAAAAVAAGIVPAAHGSDGAGSVRLPAALCNIVGFKPSYGVIPRYPISDQWGGRSHHGVLGRTVDDVRFAMQGFAVVDQRDPMTVPAQIDFSDDQRSGVSEGYLRFSALETWGGCYVDPEIRNAVLGFADRLVDMGLEQHTVGDTPDIGLMFERLYLPQLSYDIGQLSGSQRELLGHEVQYWADRAKQVDFVQYMTARDERGRLNRWCSEAFADVDFIVLPAQNLLAWPVDKAPLETVSQSEESIGSRLQFLAVFNLLGWPAISLPLGMSKDGRAIGVQLVCRRGEDSKLLDIATGLEQMLKA